MAPPPPKWPYYGAHGRMIPGPARLIDGGHDGESAEPLFAGSYGDTGSPGPLDRKPPKHTLPTRTVDL